MDTTIKTIEPKPASTENLLVPLVDPRRQISKIGVNKIARDAMSKCEMIVRDLPIPGLLNSSYNRHRVHWNYFSIRLSLDDKMKNELTALLGKRIVDNDNTLKNLRESVRAIESQYISYLTNLGLKYQPPSYNDPYEALTATFSETVVGGVIASGFITGIQAVLEEIKKQFEDQVKALEEAIRKEAVRLNTTDHHQRKRRRTDMLINFAETKLKQLIICRDELKRRVIDAYENCKTTKFKFESHEEHGPTAIL